jgi:hypothetical protein
LLDFAEIYNFLILLVFYAGAKVGISGENGVWFSKNLRRGAFLGF